MCACGCGTFGPLAGCARLTSGWSGFLAYAASRLGVNHVWIISGALIIIGLGLMAGIVKTRQKDPAP